MANSENLGLLEILIKAGGSCLGMQCNYCPVGKECDEANPHLTNKQVLKIAKNKYQKLSGMDISEAEELFEDWESN